MLYQRYFLRMNQNNTTHIVSLLLALVLLLGSIHIVFALIVATSSASASDPFSSLEVVGIPSTAFSGDAAAAVAANSDGAVAAVMWDNGTTTTTSTGAGVSVDNSNFTVLSDNLTMWDAVAANETLSVAGSTRSKMSNYFAPNILALVITLGICGTICICKYLTHDNPQITLNYSTHDGQPQSYMHMYLPTYNHHPVRLGWLRINAAEGLIRVAVVEWSGRWVGVHHHPPVQSGDIIYNIY